MDDGFGFFFCFAELKSGFLNSCQRFLALRLIFDEEELHHIFFFRFEVDSGAGAEVGNCWKKWSKLLLLGRCLCDTSERCGKRSPSAVSMPSRCCRRCFRFVLWVVVQAHGRVSDPMAKLQFLRVGWGGVGMMMFLELAHMLDATQLCLSCHRTHAGCYATTLVLSLHTCWMLRNCVGLVIARMLDATQLCLSCHRTHTRWMLRNRVGLVIAHMLDATQLCWLVIAHTLDATQPCWSCHCTHAGCYATEFVLSLHTCWMLRNCVCLVIAYTLDATQLHWSCHCTQREKMVIK